MLIRIEGRNAYAVARTWHARRCSAQRWFFFRERLAQKPLLELVAGLLLMVGALQFIFGAIASAYTWSQRIAQNYQREALLIRESAEKAEEEGINREFQSALIRLGCYEGNVDGVWGDQSKTALTEFLDAIGKTERYGTSVKVSDARALFAESQDGVCTRVRRTASLRRYRTVHNDFLGQCMGHFLFVPFEKTSPACTTLKSQRDEAARTLKALGVTLPG